MKLVATTVDKMVIFNIEKFSCGHTISIQGGLDGGCDTSLGLEKHKTMNEGSLHMQHNFVLSCFISFMMINTKNFREPVFTRKSKVNFL